MQKNRYWWLPAAALFMGSLQVSSAQAFGLGDVVGAAVNFGAKVGSAAVSKAVDSMKDPVAEAEKKQREEEEFQRKRTEAFNKAAAGIEARTDLTPLSREKLLISLRQSSQMVGAMRRFAQEAEARQKAERDNVLSAGGLLGAAVESTAAMPSVAIAKADLMVKAGIPQAQARDALSRVDNKGNVIARPSDAVISAIGQQAQKEATASANANLDRQTTELKAMAQQAVNDEKQSQPEAPGAEDILAQDRTKTIHVQFVQSEKLTNFLRQALKARGYQVTENVEEAQVKYLFEGEFEMAETKLREGMRLDVGNYYDTPKPLQSTPEKTSGTIKKALTFGLLALGSVQGGNTQGANALLADPVQKQRVLIVGARQLPGEQETRISSIVDDVGTTPKPAEMITAGLKEIFGYMAISFDQELKLASQ